MAVELKVPEVGESITEVEIGKWTKREGDTVRQDETIAELETDKVTVELPAPADGTLTKLLKKKGEPAKVGEVIGYLEAGEVSQASQASSQSSKKEADPRPIREAGPDQANAVETKTGQQDSYARVMPAAQRLIDEHKLDPGDIKATGPGGRLLKHDVQRHLHNRPATADRQPATEPQPNESAHTGTRAAEPAPLPVQGEREEQAVPMSPLRRRVAQRLVEAQHNAALLTTFNEIDMTGVMTLRSQYKDAFEKKYNVKLGFMSFFVKASIDALKQFPAVNAEIREHEIIYKNYYDIGIAIGSGKGLVVPVLRNAEQLSFAEIEQAIGDFARRVQDNQIKLDELQGGTFTITNGGVYGSLLSTPIINPPQSGVLGMHAIQKRPIAVNDEIKIRPMMYVALTYDHRIVDGREAVSFLKRLKDAIEEPNRMLMEI